MIHIKQAVIFAGGLGERLKPFTKTNPKPMYPFNNKPFLEYLITQISNWGIKDIIILLGYLPEKITEYFDDGSKWDVNIRYVITPVEYDTQLRLKAASDCLRDEFLMMYCDNLCPVNFQRLVSDYEKNSAVIQVTAYANEDGYTRHNMKIRADGQVTVYDRKRTTEDLGGVDIGYAIVSKRALSYMSNQNDNFETVVYKKLVAEGKLYATVTRHRYYSIGSFDRINFTKQYLSGQKYIFIDRDGVLNERAPNAEYITKPEDFKWLSGAKEAVKRLKDAGYFIVMISNQAGIARGMMTEADFEKIQKKMQADLAEIGAHIDATYYCPHGWDDECGCRKPKPGMIYQAQKDYSINLSECVMMGDDVRDVMTAHNADMKGILITDEYTLSDAVEDVLHGFIKEDSLVQ